MLIKTLDKFDEFEELVEFCNNLLKRVPFEDGTTQLALQGKDPFVGDWYESCGSVYKNGEYYPLQEDSYTFINPELKGTVVDRWLKSLGFGTHRARLMFMSGRKCYSIHKDITPRVHIPLITNKDCLMCFPQHSVMQHMPATGESYWVDTTKEHTFINCSSLDRIHLVASTRFRIMD